MSRVFKNGWIDMQKQKIKFFFEKLKEAHEIYMRSSNEKKAAIFDAFDWVFIKLESLGVNRIISEALLIGGKEFVDSLVDDTKRQQMTSESLQLKESPLDQGFSDELVIAEIAKEVF